MLATLIATALLQAAAPPPADLEDKAVLAATQAFFDGMAANDVGAMRAAGLPDMQMMALSTKPDGSIDVRRISFEDSFGKHPPVGLKEWMWSPIIARRGPLATVTGPYEFARDKQGDAWKVASISWTVEPGACPELRKL
jgi:hypothetical protein